MKNLHEIEGFPSDYAHPKDKVGQKWALQAAKAIWDYGNHYAGWNYQDRNERFHLNELLAQGRQSEDRYKPIWGDRDGNVNYMHMFWQVTSPLARYMRSIVRSLTERKFKPKATGFDSTSKTEKDAEYSKLKGNLLLKQTQESLFQGTGINLVPDGEYVPSNFEEVELRKELGFKSSVEMAQEITLDVILENNEIEKNQIKTATDLSNKSWACVECFKDDNGDIRFESFSPFDLLVPYSEDGYFDKSKWKARRKRFTVNEIRLHNERGETPIYSNEELFELAQKFSGRNGNPDWNQKYLSYNYDQRWNSFIIEALCYEIETVNDFAWVSKQRSKGGIAIGSAKPNTKQKQSDKKELIKKARSVYYDGIWVIGSEKVLKHELRSNMVFEGQNFYDNKPESRFVVVAPELYQMRNKALPESAEPYVDRMATAMYKFQQLLNEIKPPTKKIDIRALKGVMEGLGVKNGKPMDIFAVERQMSILFYNGENTMTGAAQNQNPVAELPSYIRNEMVAIQDAYNTALQALENDLGINDTMIGQNRNQYEGFGSRQLKQANGEKAVSHLYNAQQYLWDKVLKVLSLMAQDTIVLGEGDKIKGWQNAIGRANLDIIKIQKDLTLAELGIKIEMLPTQEDLEQVYMELERALQRDAIRIEDAQMVREIAKSNTKLAIQYMTLKRKEYLKDRMLEAENAAKANGMQQQQSTQVAHELKMQEKEIEFQRESQLKEFESLLRRTEQDLQTDNEIEVVDREGEWKTRHIQEANENALDSSEIENNQTRQPQVYTGSSGR